MATHEDEEVTETDRANRRIVPKFYVLENYRDIIELLPYLNF